MSKKAIDRVPSVDDIVCSNSYTSMDHNFPFKWKYKRDETQQPEKD
jgi:hypothetical protein